MVPTLVDEDGRVVESAVCVVVDELAKVRVRSPSGGPGPARRRAEPVRRGQLNRTVCSGYYWVWCGRRMRKGRRASRGSWMV